MLNQKALVAVDLGAQSCRVSLLRWDNGKANIHVVRRFPNSPITSDHGLRWDIGKIFDGVVDGLRSCASLAPEGIASIAVDGWAVDYVRLSQHRQAPENPFCYRDRRTELAEEKVHAILAPPQLYALTGIQILRINTLYQLYADKLAGADIHAPWLLLPEYITYRLGGRPVAEYTNATHTGLVQLGTHHWCAEIFNELGLDLATAPEIVSSGTIVGSLQGDLAQIPGFRETKLIAAATHDTAAAIAAIPANGDDWAFISSGTWSLVGTVVNWPCVNDAARDLNFTNLGVAGGKTGFLKNVNGMWLLGQCMDEWERAGRPVTIPQLISACADLPAPSALINVDDPLLMLPGDTLKKINAQLARAGHDELGCGPAEIPHVANLIFHSLAARYAEVLSSIQQATGKKLRRLFIVGGGSQNHYLNQLTAERTGLQVVLGATEGTTIGNFAIQLAAFDGHWNSANGVSVESVAHYAAQLAAGSFALSSSGETN